MKTATVIPIRRHDLAPPFRCGRKNPGVAQHLFDVSGQGRLVAGTGSRQRRMPPDFVFSSLSSPRT